MAFLRPNKKCFRFNFLKVKLFIKTNQLFSQDILWKSGFQRLYGDMPGRRNQPETAHDACRIHGSLTLNKVAGNFHVTAGKVIFFCYFKYRNQIQPLEVIARILFSIII